MEQGKHSVWGRGHSQDTSAIPLQPIGALCPKQRYPHTAPGGMTATSDQNSVTSETPFGTQENPLQSLVGV